MADQEETGLPAETDDIGTPDPTQEPAGEPAAADAATAAEPEATPPAGEPATPSIDDIPLDSLLEREDVKRWAQSVGDRATAKAEGKLRAEARQRETDAKQAAEVARRKQLRESEDYDELGRIQAAKDDEQERLMESLHLAGEAITSVQTERYTRELGEETVAKIAREVDANGGNFLDLQQAFADEVTQRAVKKATGSAIEEAEKRFSDKLEAALTDAGVKKRSAEVKETGPVDKISGAPADTGASGDEDTYETMSTKYGKGEASWAEFEPFKKAHDLERTK